MSFGVMKMTEQTSLILMAVAASTAANVATVGIIYASHKWGEWRNDRAWRKEQAQDEDNRRDKIIADIRKVQELIETIFARVA
jgi:hypothetical protein